MQSTEFVKRVSFSSFPPYNDNRSKMSLERRKSCCKCCFPWGKTANEVPIGVSQKEVDERTALLHESQDIKKKRSYDNPLIDPVSPKDSPETKKHPIKIETNRPVLATQEAERSQTIDTVDTAGRSLETPQETKLNKRSGSGGSPVNIPQKEGNQKTDKTPSVITTKTIRKETKDDSGKTKELTKGNQEGKSAEPSKETNVEAASSTPKESELITFTQFNIKEIDSIFDGIKETLNPFVVNRENMEKAEKDFKKAVSSLEKISPKASFADYVEALKTKLKKENIFIKIKNGMVVFGGEVGKTFDAIMEVKSAIEDMIKAEEGLRKMLPAIVLATEDGLLKSGNIDVKKIFKREFKSVFDGAKILRLKNAFSDNVKKMKKAPTMVQEFYNEARSIIMALMNAFADKEEKERISKEMPPEDKKKGNKGKGKISKDSKSKDKGDEKHEDKNETGQSGNKRKGEEEKKKQNSSDKKDKEFIKQLKVDSIGIPDIDNIFQDFVKAVNPFILAREQLEAARDSFVTIMKTITEFEATKSLKEYLKELKEKAEKGDIHIYIDVSDGEIKLKSISGVPPPKEYRDAAKTLTNIKKAANDLEKLEPGVQRGVEDIARHIVKVKPESDFRKMIKFKELPKLPKKIITFNDNRKKIQQAPAAIKEFIVYVKDLLVDIAEFFSEDKKPEDKKSNDKESDEKKSDEKKSDEKKSGEEKSGDREPEDKKSKDEKFDDKEPEKSGPNEASEPTNVEGCGNTTKESSEEHNCTDPNDTELSTSGAGFAKSDEEYEDARSGRSVSPSVEVAGLMKSDDQYVDAKTVLA